jgi:acetyltransferase-like isoleucine patch superfamily enzyme
VVGVESALTPPPA